MAGRGHDGGPPGRAKPRLGGGPDRAALGLIGVICAIAGFFVLGIVLGPIAILCGWLAMNRTWSGARPVPAIIAVVLGAIDTVLAIIWLAGSATSGTGFF